MLTGTITKKTSGIVPPGYEIGDKIVVKDINREQRTCTVEKEDGCSTMVGIPLNHIEFDEPSRPLVMPSQRFVSFDSCRFK